PEAPISHCFARPEIAETESIRDQMGFAFMTGFRGKLHFVHVSTSLGVDYINLAKQRGLDVSCGVCPHHFYFNWNDMWGDDGIELKMNPPLREPGEPEKLLEALRDGRIDFVETDHAPHTWNDKYKLCASGVPALAWWPVFEEFLKLRDFTERRIEEVMFKKPIERFGVDIGIRKRRRIVDHRGDYAFNPWWRMEEEVGMRDSL
ncbi:MAG: hypothetical protein IIA87_05295, partial [Nanoarchaeota archaeon]|nr:hypothetical protein [Nanoarchaeota archaeon]